MPTGQCEAACWQPSWGWCLLLYQAEQPLHKVYVPSINKLPQVASQEAEPCRLICSCTLLQERDNRRLHRYHLLPPADRPHVSSHAGTQASFQSSTMPSRNAHYCMLRAAPALRPASPYASLPAPQSHGIGLLSRLLGLPACPHLCSCTRPAVPCVRPSVATPTALCGCPSARPSTSAPASASWSS